jgi:hypothetical protein
MLGLVLDHVAANIAGQMVLCFHFIHALRVAEHRTARFQGFS